MEEGPNTKGKLWLQLTGLDNLNQQMISNPTAILTF
jgi:hypothetical protein